MKKITHCRIALLKAIMESDRSVKEKKSLVEAVRNTSDRDLTIKILKKINEVKYVPKELKHPISTWRGDVGAIGGAIPGMAVAVGSKSKLGLAGGVLLSLAGMLYGIDKMTIAHKKKCAQFKGNDIQYYQCKIAASKDIISKLSVLRSNCKKTKNPQKCFNKINAQIEIWKEQLEDDRRDLIDSVKILRQKRQRQNEIAKKSKKAGEKK